MYQGTVAMRIRNAIAGLVLALTGIVSAGGARAGEPVPYTTAGFEEAVSANVPLIIGVWADWCGVCQTQIGAIRALTEQPEYAAVVVIEVDYDTQRHIMLRFNVSFRSTIIAFRNGQEVRRLDAVTDTAEIEALLVDVMQAAR